MTSWPYSGDGKLTGHGRNTRIIHCRILYDDPGYLRDREMNKALDDVRRLLSTSEVVRMYFAKTYNNPTHELWFEGKPGKELRELRGRITELLKPYNARPGRL